MVILLSKDLKFMKEIIHLKILKREFYNFILFSNINELTKYLNLKSYFWYLFIFNGKIIYKFELKFK